MRAAVLHEPYDLRVEDRPDPVPGPDDLLIQVTYNGLCGTDATEFAKGPMMVPLHTRHPGSGHLGPTILGHEFIGTVVDAGEGLRDRIGSRVACGAGVSCGTCRWCRAGRTQLCSSYYTLGLSTHGGLAELVAAPARICAPIPDEVTDLDAALAQPLAVGIHAVQRGGLTPGATVAVLGCGAIGSFILAALAGHDGDVVAVDIDEGRLATARTLGASTTHRIEPTATPAEVRALLQQGADLVFETAGVHGAAERAFGMAARGGDVVLVGLNKTPQPLNLADIVLREVNVRTTVAHVCDTDIPEALKLLAERPLAGVLLDRVVPLEDVAADGFGPLVDGSATGKILVGAGRG